MTDVAETNTHSLETMFEGKKFTLTREVILFYSEGSKSSIRNGKLTRFHDYDHVWIGEPEKDSPLRQKMDSFLVKAYKEHARLSNNIGPTKVVVKTSDDKILYAHTTSPRGSYKFCSEKV